VSRRRLVVLVLGLVAVGVVALIVFTVLGHGSGDSGR
jgi:hypothetical protein